LLAFWPPLALNSAVGVLQNAITQYRDGLTGQFVATGVDPQGSILSSGGCLIVIRGPFGERDTAAPQPPGSLAPSELDRLGLAGQPAFYMELSVKRTDANVVLQPVYVDYASTAARSIGSGRKHVSAVVAFTATPPDESPAPEEAVVFFRHNLGALEIGKQYKDPTGTNLLQGTSAANVVPQDLMSAPNIVALVTESEEPSIALKALVEAFDSNKDALQKIIEEAIKNTLGSERDNEGDLG
jgi:hypothetical protein